MLLSCDGVHRSIPGGLGSVDGLIRAVQMVIDYDYKLHNDNNVQGARKLTFGTMAITNKNQMIVDVILWDVGMISI